jgi:hypothetical protein
VPRPTSNATLASETRRLDPTGATDTHLMIFARANREINRPTSLQHRRQGDRLQTVERPPVRRWLLLPMQPSTLEPGTRPAPRSVGEALAASADGRSQPPIDVYAVGERDRLGIPGSRSRLTGLLSEQEVAPLVPLVDGGIVVFRQLIAHATVIHVVWIPVSAVS